jgi:hypothetical protein
MHKQLRVVLSNVLGGKDIVEGRDGLTNGRVEYLSDVFV